ncbi:unnamed protein product [Effrenium voratum]|nr:unnamed protein product [Effrenium voratum]
MSDGKEFDSGASSPLQEPPNSKDADSKYIREIVELREFIEAQFLKQEMVIESLHLKAQARSRSPGPRQTYSMQRSMSEITLESRGDQPEESTARTERESLSRGSSSHSFVRNSWREHYPSISGMRRGAEVVVESSRETVSKGFSRSNTIEIDPLTISPLRAFCLSTVSAALFTNGIMLLILVNLVLLGVEVDRSTQVGEKDIPRWFGIVNTCIVAIFLVEATMKFVAYGFQGFFCGKDSFWNTLDFGVIAASVLETAVELWDLSLSSSQAGSSTGHLRIMRTMRLVRALRGIRVIRLLRYVSALRTLVFSIVSTMGSLMWTLVLLLMLFYSFGVIFTQLVSDHCRFEAVTTTGNANAIPYCEDSSIDHFWASVPESMLTLFLAISGGLSWEEALRPLRKVSELAVSLMILGTGSLAGINKLTAEYFGTAADRSMEMVHAAEISEQVMGSRASVQTFLQSLGLKNQETDEKALARGAVAVNCMDLCKKTVESIAEAKRPPSSDVACYMPYQSDVAKCDIDVSSGAFDDVEASSNAHNDATLGEGPLPGIAEGDSSEQHKLKELLNHSQNADSDDLAKLAALNYPAMSTQELTVTISNLFRIYPLNNIQAESTSGANFLQVTMADWHDEVIKLAVKAQAYTATAVRSISSPKSDDTLMLWFGSTSTSSKKEVRRVLNQVNHLLSNVEYIYPGPQCRENVFAYVHPKPPHNKNGKGQYLFYLCDEYVNADSSTKLETLSHEASHHEMSLTDDVCYKGSGDDCQKAYGRVACERLAQATPQKALRNADNYCFFVNDIQPFAKTPECPSLPRCSFDKTCSCPNGLIKREEETTTGNICFTCGKTPSKKPKPRPHNTGGDLCPADDTGGTCRVFLCSRTRGPTTCASGKCVCETGLCAENGYCVPPKVGGESLGSEPDDTCDTATGGTCKFLWCFHSRGPTSCIDGVCHCKEGYCNKGGTCEPKLGS